MVVVAVVFVAVDECALRTEVQSFPTAGLFHTWVHVGTFQHIWVTFSNGPVVVPTVVPTHVGTTVGHTRGLTNTYFERFLK